MSQRKFEITFNMKLQFEYFSEIIQWSRLALKLASLGKQIQNNRSKWMKSSKVFHESDYKSVGLLCFFFFFLFHFFQKQKNDKKIMIYSSLKFVQLIKHDTSFYILYWWQSRWIVIESHLCSAYKNSLIWSVIKKKKVQKWEKPPAVQLRSQSFLSSSIKDTAKCHWHR